MVTHVSIGDPSVGSGVSTAAQPGWCFCACDRCLSGSCCQFPPETSTGLAQTVTTNTLDPFGCGTWNHDYHVLMEGGRELYCRKCGATRKV